MSKICKNNEKYQKYMKKSQEMVNLWTNRPLGLNTNFKKKYQ